MSNTTANSISAALDRIAAADKDLAMVKNLEAQGSMAPATDWDGPQRERVVRDLERLATTLESLTWAKATEVADADMFVRLDHFMELGNIVDKYAPAAVNHN